MSGEKEPEAPALPGEVWRGLDEDGDPVAVTLVDGKADAWYENLVGQWEHTGGLDIMALWALHERAKVEKAVDHLRKWQRQAGPGHPLAEAVNDALRALGVEP